MISITFLGRKPVHIIDICKDAWEACEQALKATGYTSAQIVGSYNCRHIAGRPTTSLHGYGLALDIDPRANWKHLPFSKTKIKRRNVIAIEAIRTNNGRRVFTCGTRFADPMHIQIACTPNDLKTGIKWSTVQGHSSHRSATATKTGSSAAAHPVLRQGSTKRTVVTEMQNRLRHHGSHIKADGLFGPKTRTALRRFQRDNKLRVDAVCGPATWKKLLT